MTSDLRVHVERGLGEEAEIESTVLKKLEDIDLYFVKDTSIDKISDIYEIIKEQIDEIYEYIEKFSNQKEIVIKIKKYLPTHIPRLKWDAAIYRGNLEECKKFFYENPEARGRAFLIACDEDNVELVEFFAKEIPKADYLNDYKYRALSNACFYHHFEIVKIIVEEIGIDLSKDIRYNYGFEAACSNGDIKLIKYLLEKGADPLMRSQEAIRKFCYYDYNLLSDEYQEKIITILDILVNETFKRKKEIHKNAFYSAILYQNINIVYHLISVYQKKYNIDIYTLLKRDKCLAFFLACKSYKFTNNTDVQVLDIFINHIEKYMNQFQKNFQSPASLKPFLDVFQKFYVLEEGEILDDNVYDDEWYYENINVFQFGNHSLSHGLFTNNRMNYEPIFFYTGTKKETLKKFKEFDHNFQECYQDCKQKYIEKTFPIIEEMPISTDVVSTHILNFLVAA